MQPPSGTDTMVKAGVTTSINTKHQCITAMKEYENKSLEVSLDRSVPRRDSERLTGERLSFTLSLSFVSASLFM